MDNHKHIGFAVKALIRRGDEFLILKKSGLEDVNPNSWDIPGGRVNYGEDPEDALIREINEETGLKVKNLRLLNLWNILKEELNLYLIGANYLCEFVSGDLRLSHEHKTAKWVNIKEILNNKEYPKWIQLLVKKIKNEAL